MFVIQSVLAFAPVPVKMGEMGELKSLICTGNGLGNGRKQGVCNGLGELKIDV